MIISLMQGVEVENVEIGKELVVKARTVAGLTLLSRVLGLVRDGLMTAIFPRPISDAWVVAFRFPNLVRRILGEGALSSVLVPTEFQRSQGPDIWGFFNALVLGVGFLVACGVFSAPLWMPLEGVARELALRQVAVMWPYVIFLFVGALFAALLQLRHLFFWGAFAPVIWNATMILFLCFPQRWATWDGEFLAWGVLVGGVFQAASLWWATKRLQILSPFRLHFDFLAVGTLFWKMVPTTLSIGVFQILGLVNSWFASRMGEGTNSWIFLADRLLELPVALVIGSLSTALLPALAEAHSTGNFKKESRLVFQAMRLTFFLCMPATVGLVALRLPLIEVFFLRGNFGAQDLAGTARALFWTALVLPSLSFYRIFLPLFFARQRFRTPLLISLFILACHVTFSMFSYKSGGLTMILMSTAGSMALGAIGSFYFLRLQTDLNLKELVRFGLRVLLSSGVLWVFLRLALVAEQHLNFQTWWSRATYLGFLVLFGAGIFIGVGRLLKVQEAQTLVACMRQVRNESV